MMFVSYTQQPTLPRYQDLGRDRQRRTAAQSSGAAAAMGATSMSDVSNCNSCPSCSDLAAEMEQREYERRLMEQYSDADGRVCTCAKCQVRYICTYRDRHVGNTVPRCTYTTIGQISLSRSMERIWFLGVFGSPQTVIWPSPNSHLALPKRFAPSTTFRWICCWQLRKSLEPQRQHHPRGHNDHRHVNNDQGKHSASKFNQLDPVAGFSATCELKLLRRKPANSELRTIPSSDTVGLSCRSLSCSLTVSPFSPPTNTQSREPGPQDHLHCVVAIPPDGASYYRINPAANQQLSGVQMAVIGCLGRPPAEGGR